MGKYNLCIICVTTLLINPKLSRLLKGEFLGDWPHAILQDTLLHCFFLGGFTNQKTAEVSQEKPGCVHLQM